MTDKVYKVYTRREEEEWEERLVSFAEPNINRWDNPNIDVRVVVIALDNVENLVSERRRCVRRKIQKVHCEQCMSEIKYGDTVYTYTEYFPDYDDGHAVEANHVFCCKYCGDVFVGDKVHACTLKNNFEYNHIDWDWEEEENEDDR